MPWSQNIRVIKNNSWNWKDINPGDFENGLINNCWSGHYTTTLVNGDYYGGKPFRPPGFLWMMVQLFVWSLQFSLKKLQDQFFFQLCYLFDRRNSWIKSITLHTLQCDFPVVAASSARNNLTCRFHETLSNCVDVHHCKFVTAYTSPMTKVLSPYLREKISYFQFDSPKESGFKRIDGNFFERSRVIFARFVKWISRQPWRTKLLFPNMVANSKFGW